jgi:hypothetical protein
MSDRFWYFVGLPFITIATLVVWWWTVIDVIGGFT